LRQRIDERIRMHEATIGALDARIAHREGDQLFDVRAEDGYKTLGELISERDQYRGRVVPLALLRDGLVVGEIYALGKADLRLAELIPIDCAGVSGAPEERCADGNTAAIDGLKLTMPGQELRSLLEQRIDVHQRRAEGWKREEARTPEEQTDEEPLLPEHMCANEAERHTWRASVLGFIRDHVDAAGTYRLGEADLAFGEVLPEQPGWMEQQEYEERTNVGFQLERLTKSVGGLVPREFAFLHRTNGNE